MQACQILTDQLGGLEKTSKYTFVDACAGGGGPTPLLEKQMNRQLQNAGFNPVQFILTDLWPDLKAWREIKSKSQHISYHSQPIDATQAIRLVGADERECRMFNLSFHHFGDDAAAKVLKGAVNSSDAFM